MSKTHYFIIWILLVFCFSCKKQGKVVGINPEDFTIEDQLTIGNAFRVEIENNPGVFKILDESQYKEAHAYLDFLMNTILNTPTVVNRDKLEWEISILHDDTLRMAFVLPSGHLFIYTGLLKFLETEHQLLALMAHEMYYADTDLMVQRLKSAFGGVILGDILLGYEVEELGGMVEEIPYLDFAEEEVLNADTYSVNVLCPFRYSPLGIREVMEKEEMTQISVHWLEKRACEKELRLENLETNATGCTLNGLTNESSYQKFKTEQLP